jgi:hypothetical protein
VFLSHTHSSLFFLFLSHFLLSVKYLQTRCCIELSDQIFFFCKTVRTLYVTRLTVLCGTKTSCWTPSTGTVPSAPAAVQYCTFFYLFVFCCLFRWSSNFNTSLQIHIVTCFHMHHITFFILAALISSPSLNYFYLFFSDVVDENALLLFEILDHRPSLNFNKDQGIQGPRPYKQVYSVVWCGVVLYCV